MLWNEVWLALHRRGAKCIGTLPIPRPFSVLERQELAARPSRWVWSRGVPGNNHYQAPRSSSADPIPSSLPKRQLERQPRCPCSSLPLAASERDEKPLEWRAAHILFVSIR